MAEERQKDKEIKNPLIKNFSKNVNRLRNNKGITQEELAENLQVATRTIQKWEKGEVLPRKYSQQIVANFFEVSIEDLLGLKQRQSEKKGTISDEAVYADSLKLSKEKFYDTQKIYIALNGLSSFLVDDL